MSYPKGALVRPLLFRCLLTAAMLAGCTQESAKPPADQGFYRQLDGAAVYYVQPGPKTVCMVSNPSMMEAYGGFKVVHVVGRNVDILGAGKLSGSCRWPAGFYRKPNADVVYQVRATDVCRVRVPAKVHASTVSADSNVLIALPYAGDCP